MFGVEVFGVWFEVWGLARPLCPHKPSILAIGESKALENLLALPDTCYPNKHDFPCETFGFLGKPEALDRNRQVKL